MASSIPLRPASGSPSTPRTFLSTAVARGRLPHALLFLGPDGGDREDLARDLARGLLCTAEPPAPPFGCGACSSCRRVTSGTHPDVHVVAPEAELVRRGMMTVDGSRKPSRDIRVEQIRELTREMRLLPYEGRARVAIVLDAHRMTPGGSNALLKTLEEPGPASVLVLLAPHERSLLPTIASRAARLRFAPSPSTTAPLEHDGVTPADDGTRALIDALLDSSPSSRLKAIEDVGRDRDAALDALDGLAAFLTAHARARHELGPSPAPDAPLDDVAIVRWLDAIRETRRAIVGNAHVQIALEELLLLEGR